MPFTPSGKTATSWSCSSSRSALNGDATTPPTLRIPSEIHGRSNAQSSTRKRGWRGRGCSRSRAIEIIVASHGRMPAWLEVSSTRPCAGTRSTPSTFTLHQVS